MKKVNVTLLAMGLACNGIVAMQHESSKASSQQAQAHDISNGQKELSPETRKTMGIARDVEFLCESETRRINEKASSLRLVLFLLTAQCSLEIGDELKRKKEPISLLKIAADIVLAGGCFWYAYGMKKSLSNQVYEFARKEPAIAKRILAEEEACKKLDPEILKGLRAGIRDLIT